MYVFLFCSLLIKQATNMILPVMVKGKGKIAPLVRDPVRPLSRLL